MTPCPKCHGNCWVTVNDTPNNDPQRDVDVRCDCDGGQVEVTDIMLEAASERALKLLAQAHIEPSNTDEATFATAHNAMLRVMAKTPEWAYAMEACE